MSYHNTTGLDDRALEERLEQAETQEERAEAFFRAREGRRFTPFEVQDQVFPETPITSVRRAITNLTEAGVLRKTEETRPGRYGEPNHTWTLAPPAGEQSSLFESRPQQSTRAAP